VIEAVLFDGDQTLWDFQKVMRAALLAVIDELKTARPGAIAARLRPRDLAEDRDGVAMELSGVEFNLRRLRQLGFARTLQRFRAEGAVPWTEDQEAALVDRLVVTYFHHRDLDPALFLDTLPCLNALRSRFRLGLLSNGSRLPETIGLGGYFESVVFAQDHRVAKPDRAIFEVVERGLQVAPDVCVLVGDHPLNDVAGAKRSGWRSVWIDRTGDGTYPTPFENGERPDAIIGSLAELPDALATL
jgi:HAD superfamily hydrolase (TIGR01509 family)